LVWCVCVRPSLYPLQWFPDITWERISNFVLLFGTPGYRNGTGIILPVQQDSYGPLIMSIMLVMSCYTRFFNVRRGWQSLTLYNCLYSSYIIVLF
jgi:hypothetical protein